MAEGHPDKENPYRDSSKELKKKDITEDFLSENPKPKNSRDPKKWIDKGGSIKVDDNGIWEYINKDGISIKYPDGYPDFSEFYHPTIEPVKIDITVPADSALDFKKANQQAGLSTTSTPLVPSIRRPPEGWTWHHLEDGETMVLVNKKIHAEFTHVGGQHLVNGTGSIS